MGQSTVDWEKEVDRKKSHLVIFTSSNIVDCTTVISHLDSCFPSCDWDGGMLLFICKFILFSYKMRHE